MMTCSTLTSPSSPSQANHLTSPLTSGHLAFCAQTRKAEQERRGQPWPPHLPQFAYLPGRGLSDALDRVVSHLRDARQLIGHATEQALLA